MELIFIPLSSEKKSMSDRWKREKLEELIGGISEKEELVFFMAKWKNNDPAAIFIYELYPFVNEDKMKLYY